MKLGNYNFIEQLGKGTMGKVYLTLKEDTKQLFATKIMDRKKVQRPQVMKYFSNEIKILKTLHHKNIVRFHDLKQTDSHYYIIMDYCNGGSLLNCLKKYKKKYHHPFSEKIVQYLMKQIVSGLKYIHRHGIIHRDIKLDNILVKFYNDEDRHNLNMLKTHIKISDFGISIQPGDNHLAFTAIGSPANMDPFILKKLSERNDLANSEGYDQSADIWSLGSVCYEMLIGKRVFNGRNIKDLTKKVEEGNYTLPTNLSYEVVSFINGMLQYDPTKRLNCEQLAMHKFLTKKVENFSPIDFSLILNKVGEKGIVINTKENNTIWKVFNTNNQSQPNNNININNNDIKNNNFNNNININNNNINDNINNFNNLANNNNINFFENMWNVFDKETELKLSKIPMNLLDQAPFVENDTNENNFDNNINIIQEQKTTQNKQNNNFNNINMNNMNNINNNMSNNNFNNNQDIYNKQIQKQRSDNNINRINNNINLNVTNTYYQPSPKYPKEFYSANLNKSKTIPSGNKYTQKKQEQTNSQTNISHNYNNIYPGYNNYSHIYQIPINQTQINQTQINQFPINQTQMNQFSVNQTQMNQASINQTPINQTPINQTQINKTIINHSPINQTQINQSQIEQSQLNKTQYVDDIKIKKLKAESEESCMHQ